MLHMQTKNIKWQRRGKVTVMSDDEESFDR